jgi:hypothetical protein
LNRIQDKKDDVNVQREILGVLVRTLEEDHHLIDDLIKEDATKLIVDLQKSFEGKCSEIEETCRLGLGKLVDHFVDC